MTVVAALSTMGAVRPASAQDPAVQIRRVADSLLPRILVVGEPVPKRRLADRMALHAVPAVSVAVINSHGIEWAEAWGLADVATGRPATATTLFQAASISKPVAATAALTLVEDGRLDLDADVNDYLTSWQLPDTVVAQGEKVTPRRLLTHTAGLTVHGFPGYARSERIPTAVEVLDGKGNTDPVRIGLRPGIMWRYSGGGYTVLQVLLGDVAGVPFDVLMQERVLEPVGMALSTYESPLSRARSQEAATGYRGNGAPVEESWHVYPEQAAAGLWTTPSDLARWGLAILAAYDGQPGGVLSPAMARQMLTPGLGGYGLGPAVQAERLRFGHGGSNEGFRCALVVFFDGRGAAIMTNGDGGSELMSEILATLAVAYDWPDFKPVEKAVAAIDRSGYPDFVGTYRVPGRDVEAVVSLEGGRLYVGGTRIGSAELLPESDLVFFSREDGTRFTFIRQSGTIVAVSAMGLRAEKAR
ncbi:MAG: beta-lactamase family protein [Gemmatimonadota bacterium]|nr:beta-lactamase family protein [Gemmatimonadota bacterium]